MDEDTAIRVWAGLATVALIMVVSLIVTVPERGGSVTITDNVVGGYSAERASASQEDRARAMALQLGLMYPSGGLWVTEDPSFPYCGLYVWAQDAIVLSSSCSVSCFDRVVAHELGHANTSYPLMLLLLLAPLILMALAVGNIWILSKAIARKRRVLVAIALAVLVFIVLANIGLIGPHSAVELPALRTEGVVTGSHLFLFRTGAFLFLCLALGASLVLGRNALTGPRLGKRETRRCRWVLATVVVALSVCVAGSSLGVWERRQKTMDDVLALPNVWRVTDPAGNPVAEMDIRFYSFAENLGMAPPKGGLFWADLLSSRVAALGCYFPDVDVIVLDWSLAGGGADFYRVAAHELGHSNTSGWVWTASDLFDIFVVTIAILLAVRLLFRAMRRGLRKAIDNLRSFMLTGLSVGAVWIFFYFAKTLPLAEVVACVSEAKAGYYTDLLLVGVPFAVFSILCASMVVYLARSVRRGCA